MVNCEYCGKEFSTKPNLKVHQTKTKYCLDIQKLKGIVPELIYYNCRYCDKQFSIKYNLHVHENTCKYPYTQEYETKNGILTTQILLVEQENKLLKDSIKENTIKYEKQIEKYEKQIDDYKKQLEEYSIRQTNLIEKFGSKTNTINRNSNNSNVTINNNKLDLSEARIKQAVKFYDMEHYERGAIGVADWVSKQLLTGENGNLNYHCTDKSRCNFSYTDKDGNKVRDEKAEILKSAIKPVIAPEIKKYNKVKINEIMDIDIEDDEELIDKCSKLNKENRDLGPKFEKRLVENMMCRNKPKKEKKHREKEDDENDEEKDNEKEEKDKEDGEDELYNYKSKTDKYEYIDDEILIIT